MTIGQAIPPLTVKNRGDALIRDGALNRANTVRYGLSLAFYLLVCMKVVLQK